jgi:phosphoglycolate phosphatase
MRRFDLILFDLDGTLTDPQVGITSAIRYALARLGIDPPDQAVLVAFIGPPLRESFKRTFGLDDAGAEHALALYRDYFAERGIFENQVFAGIPELLAELHARGTRMMVATGKPTVYAERIVAHFELDRFFEAAIGCELDGRRSTKEEVIAECLVRAPEVARERIAMVGDHAHDVQGARKHGVTAVAVGYGFGSPDEIAAARPDLTAETVADLRALLA